MPRNSSRTASLPARSWTVPLSHLLPRDAADQLPQQALVRVEQAVVDVVAAVDPAGLDVGEAAVADRCPVSSARPSLQRSGSSWWVDGAAARERLRLRASTSTGSSQRRVGRRRRAVVEHTRSSLVSSSAAT